ncbi:hypothetical protein REPUB_Repub10bG0139400 [Reevesia pubescens]
MMCGALLRLHFEFETLISKSNAKVVANDNCSEMCRMDSELADSSSQPPAKASDVETPAKAATDVKQPGNTNDTQNYAKANDVEPSKAADNAPTISVETVFSHDLPPFVLSPMAISSWPRNLKFPQPIAPSQGRDFSFCALHQLAWVEVAILDSSIG